MKILLTGGTGFVGTHLTSRLLKEAYEITILTRSLSAKKITHPNIDYWEGDPTKEGKWQEKIKDHEAVINLAGASIFAKWTEEHKKAIRESRISTTRNIVAGIPSQTDASFTLFNASAVGYYGFHEDEELTEDSPPGSDFLAQVARDWETEAWPAKEKGARVIITRFGIVLGEKGGALGQMVPLFKKYLGGPIGSGRQWFSWIHIKDLVEAFIFLLKNPELSGPFNFCSPNPVRNEELATTLGKILNRPSFLPAPGFLVRLVLGEFGSVILQGQRVIPRRLLDEGFRFQYPYLKEALQDIVF